MKHFNKFKKLISSFFLVVLLSAPLYSVSAQKISTAEDSTQTQIQEKSFKERKESKTTKFEQSEETTSDLSSYTFVFYLIYKFISNIAGSTDR